MYSILPAAKRYSSSHGHCSASQPAKGPTSESQQLRLVQIPQSAVVETRPVIAKLRNQKNKGTKRHSEKLGDENLCEKKSPETVSSWGGEVPRKIQTPKSRTQPFHSNILTCSQESSFRSDLISTFTASK